MEICFELGKEQDIDELENLYNTLNDHLAENINYPGWLKGVYPIREDAEKGIEEGCLYVARVEGKIAGTIILRHRPEEAYRKVKWQIDVEDDQIFVIYTFAVHPAYLKQGIGKALMSFAVEHAKKHNAKAVRLDVYEKNMPAIHLYEKCGFKYIDCVDLGYSMYGLEWYKLYEKIL